MRIARRRSDGGWTFSAPSPGAPFSPSGIGDAIPTPPPRAKRAEKAKAALAGFGRKHKLLPHDGYLDADALAYPPPAYGAADV
jgi:hypothetical protein